MYNAVPYLKEPYALDLNRLSPLSLYKLLFRIATAIVFLIRLYILL
jgi:hypothetical protein